MSIDCYLDLENCSDRVFQQYRRNHVVPSPRGEGPLSTLRRPRRRVPSARFYPLGAKRERPALGAQAMGYGSGYWQSVRRYCRQRSVEQRTNRALLSGGAPSAGPNSA